MARRVPRTLPLPLQTPCPDLTLRLYPRMPHALSSARRTSEEAFGDDGTSDSETIPGSQRSKRARLTVNGGAPSSRGSVELDDFFSQPAARLQREVVRPKQTTRKHQPGSIVRVKLKDFVTYTAVEFLPGPSLNMVIGPNGTGKSTLVCALCLGLGWGPQVSATTSKIYSVEQHSRRPSTLDELKILANMSSTVVARHGSRSS